MEENEYPVGSFEDLCNLITPENEDRLLADVVSAFKQYSAMIHMLKAIDAESSNKKNWDIAEFRFTWIDDGKTETRKIKISGPDGLSVQLDLRRKGDPPA